MRSVGPASLLLGLLATVAIAACGSVHRIGPTNAATATVRGHVSWPDCSGAGPACAPVDGIPVHFADAAARQTFTAISDGSGSYTIELPPGSYLVIAGHADRSPYQRQLVVGPGDTVELDLPISLPTGT